MTAVIVVADTPYFALSDEKGNFTVDGVSAGAYELEVWHERLGAKSMPVELEKGGRARVSVVYAAE
jgi:hypothetical protein